MADEKIYRFHVIFILIIAQNASSLLEMTRDPIMNVLSCIFSLVKQLTQSKGLFNYALLSLDINASFAKGQHIMELLCAYACTLFAQYYC